MSAMRFMLYNIRYGAGSFGPWNLLDASPSHLERIGSFIAGWAPDVLGLVEVDAGSLRARGRHQAQVIAAQLGHGVSFGCKYPAGSLSRAVPILAHQGNALTSRQPAETHRHHYLEHGVKQLVIEMETPELRVFLVHLALAYPTRQRQLARLSELLTAGGKPAIVAGDFNTLRGPGELDAFREAHGLLDANREALPSYPSWRPTRHLDFILHAPELRLSGFRRPEVGYSDHLPLVADFELPVAA